MLDVFIGKHYPSYIRARGNNDHLYVQDIKFIENGANKDCAYERVCVCVRARVWVLLHHWVIVELISSGFMFLLGSSFSTNLQRRYTPSVAKS